MQMEIQLQIVYQTIILVVYNYSNSPLVSILEFKISHIRNMYKVVKILVLFPYRVT